MNTAERLRGEKPFGGNLDVSLEVPVSLLKENDARDAISNQFGTGRNKKATISAAKAVAGVNKLREKDII